MFLLSWTSLPPPLLLCLAPSLSSLGMEWYRFLWGHRGPRLYPPPHPIPIHASLPSPFIPQLERMLKIVPSCSQSLLIHPLMLRRPRYIFTFQVIPFYLLLGCGLHARKSINSNADTTIEGSVKEIRGLLPIRICLWIIQTWLLMIKSAYKILGTW